MRRGLTVRFEPAHEADNPFGPPYPSAALASPEAPQVNLRTLRVRFSSLVAAVVPAGRGRRPADRFPLEPTHGVSLVAPVTSEPDSCSA